MSGIKTGNPGFVNPVDGKVYTVDPGAADVPALNPVNDKVDPGDMTVDKTVKDFSKPTKVTLGSYLSAATKGQVGSATTPNKYAIDPSTPASIETSLRTEGYPTPLTPASSGNSEKFASELPPSLSQDFSAFNQDEQKIKKGAVNVDAPDGHTLLPGAGSGTSPIPAYQSLAFEPNYRKSGNELTKFTAEDILSPPKTFDPSLVKYGQLSKVKPSEEAVVAGHLGLKLADVFKTPTTLTQDAKNVYPVSTPDALNLTQLASLTTNGYPTPRTEPSGQNAKVFTQNPGSSVSDDYAAAVASDGKITTLISKGKKQEKENEQLLDGNFLLQNVKLDDKNIVTLPSPLRSYYVAATDPNYRIPGTKFTTEDILSPASKSDYKLLDYSALQLLSVPTQFVPQATSLTQTLAKSVQKPKELTSQYKNFFPVNTPDEQNFNPADLFLITSPDGKFPAPLTDPGGQNGQNVFANPLINSYGNNYTILKVNSKSGLQKGKTVDSIQIDPLLPADPNGNSLLSKIVVENKEITNFDFLKSYTDSTLADNEFKPTLVFLDKGLNPLNPPKDLELKINDIPLGTEKGQYAGVIKDPVTISELQQKASDMTYGKAAEGLTPNVAAKNKYAVSPPKDYSLEPRFAQITDSNSKSPPLLTDSSNDEFFVKRDQINPASSDASLVDTGFFKGKNNPSQPYDGHNLLRKIDGTVSFADKFKDQNGRLGIHGSGLGEPNYQPGGLVDGDDGLDELGAKTGTPASSDIDHPLFKYKNNGSASSVLSFGNSRWAARGRARGSFNPMLKLSDGTEVSHLRMAKIGTGLLQRASGEIPALTADKFDPTGNLAEAGAILPSVVQAGLTKIANKTLTASDVLDSLSDGEEDPETLMNIARGFVGNDESWGAAYSSTEQFDDPGSAIGVSLTMIAMVLAINALYSFFLLADNKRKYSREQIKDDVAPTDNDRQTKGKYIFDSQDSGAFMSAFPEWREIVGIRRTVNNFSVAVGWGVRGFFVGSSKADISFGELALALLGQGLDAIIGEGSPVNANLVVCRTIVRSALVFAIAIDGIIKKFQTSGVAGAKAVLGLLRVFRASKIIASLNVFATLGDALLDRSQSLIRVAGADGSLSEINAKYKAAEGVFSVAGNEVKSKTFDVDNGAINITWSPSPDKETTSKASVRMSRLSYVGTDNSGGEKYIPTLAWSTRRAPSLYLLPSNTEKLANLGKNGASAAQLIKGLGTDLSRTYATRTSRRRIPNEVREQFEKMLDAEYVPFYFQDVRTNEIVSFHAFLISLSDDYSASYDSVEGFGRVEPVKIYKGTTRKIGLSFVVASTSHEDFQEMWQKINKLLTLIYPQYTEGRDLLPFSKDQSTSYRFKAPFSQMIGASPLVRIRLGDLLRSNYSKFSIARIFGAAEGTMTIPGAATGAGANTTTDIDFSAQKKVDSITSKVDKNTPAETDLDPKEIRNLVVLPGAVPNDFKREFSDITSVTVAKDQQGVKDGELRVKIVGPPNQYEANRIATDTGKPAPTEITRYKDFPIGKLKLSAAAVEKLRAQAGIVPSAALNDFFNPENNAIVKSFASAGGKGLAGFIESMNFDWYNQTTWETENPNEIAPKMCKVTISFAPIHDISPGIDHSGFNRAPVYRVGDDVDI